MASATFAAPARAFSGPIGVPPPVTRPWHSGLVFAFFGAIASWMLCEDILGAYSVIILWAGLRLLADEPTMILRLIFCSQWGWTISFLYYHGLTGRWIRDATLVEWREAVVVGQIAVLCLAFGMRLGIRRKKYAALLHRVQERKTFITQLPVLFPLYVVTTIFSNAILVFGVLNPGLRQVLIGLSGARLVFLYLMLTRLTRPTPRWPIFALIMAAEAILGVNGFVAGFIESFMLAMLVLLEGVINHKQRGNALALVILITTLMSLALMWTAVKPQYRKTMMRLHQQRNPDRLSTLATKWFKNIDGEHLLRDADHTVSRLWALPAQARTFRRVPALVAHTNGTFLWNAVSRLFMPRLLFPNKAAIENSSEIVEKYTGLRVQTRGTSIAFGYVCECYVDFGMPFMFLPIILWGFVAGICYQEVRKRVTDPLLSNAILAASYWSSLANYEMSWAMMLGRTFTFLLILGSIAWAITHFSKDKPDDKSPAKPSGGPQPRAAGLLHPLTVRGGF